MVKHLNHFCFVKWQKNVLRFFPVGTVVFEAIGFDLFGGMEKASVATLMKHCEEPYSPGIATLFADFVNKDGDTLINILGEIRIVFGAENRAGASVRIKELEVTGG